nr:probable serine/threonine-protein kinase NAK isoform X1 [Ipomoea batatas]
MGTCWSLPVNSVPSNNALPKSKGDNGSGRTMEVGPAKAAVAVDMVMSLPGEKDGKSREGVDFPASGRIVTPNLKMFTFSELERATRNFKPATVLGEGGFGRVFKGWIDPKTLAPSKVGVGMAVAVKKSNPDSEQGLREWQAEVKFLGKFSHPNLVKLIGYCWEDNEFLLVYEYMQKGSLESHLFKKCAETLSWETRLKIAIGAARGLAFLHSTEKQVIYRDFKASNILLDGPPAYCIIIAGWGHLYVKSDVYGFGVVLLEILTGLRVLDLSRPTREQNLVEWTKPMLADKRKIKTIVDPRLEGQYPSRAATRIAELILKCFQGEPAKRPSMDEILKSLQEINDVKTRRRDHRSNR